MCKLRQIIKNVLPGILMFVSASLLAQEDAYSRAQQLYRPNPEAAMLVIDSVILHPLTQNDFNCWTLRAFIYYEVYRKTDKFKLHSKLRDTIISSINTSFKLKPDSSIVENNKRLLKSIAIGYYNICKSLLQDSINYDRSLIAYNKFKEYYLKFDPGASFEAKDVEYYLAVGSTYSEIFIKDNNNTSAGDIAKVAFLKVIEVQPDNPSASLNMGLMYYNQAVNLSKSLDYGAEFDQIDVVQENMIKLAKQSEQFIFKVYSKDNSHIKAVEALYYIYRMLNDLPKSDEFKKKAEAGGVKFGAEGEKKDEKIENKDTNPQNKDK
jgi:tetratricopeptide (TPR) repeat protein